MGHAEEAGPAFPQMDAAQAEMIVEQAKILQAGISIEHPHAAEAGGFERHPGVFEERVQPVHEVLGFGFDGLLQRWPDFLELEQHGTGRSQS